MEGSHLVYFWLTVIVATKSWLPNPPGRALLGVAAWKMETRSCRIAVRGWTQALLSREEKPAHLLSFSRIILFVAALWLGCTKID